MMIFLNYLGLHQKAIVRITDVSLTPNNQIGRMIYDFSCTATEIGEADLKNYKLYKIQDFGD